MIDVLDDLSSGTVGFAFHGTVTGHDVDEVLIPAVTEAFSCNDHLKALLEFGPDFKACTLAAAWDDTLLGLRHWDGFERLAVVTDHVWLRESVRLIALLLPYPVRLFAGGDRDQARRWLGESLGTIHLSQEGPITRVCLIGRLDPGVYERIEPELATLLSHRPVRLILDLTDFDGWLGLGGLIHHFSLLQEHRHDPERVALVGGPAWQRFGQRLLARFSGAETRFFDRSRRLEAEAWLADGAAGPAQPTTPTREAVVREREVVNLG